MLLEFYIYRFYLKMVKSNEEYTLLRVLGAFSVLIFSLSSIFIIPFTTFLRRINFSSRFNIDGSSIEFIIYVVFLIIIPLVYSYFRFFYRKNLDYYEKKYRNHWLNKYFFNFLFTLAPVILFLIGPIVSILLFGGGILKYDFVGILTPYLQILPSC